MTMRQFRLAALRFSKRLARAVSFGIHIRFGATSHPSRLAQSGGVKVEHFFVSFLSRGTLPFGTHERLPISTSQLGNSVGSHSSSGTSHDLPISS
jgi:hypothetical protein